MIKKKAKPTFVKPHDDTFLGIRHATWFRVAKWISIGGMGLAGLITAIATAYKMIWGR